MRPRDNPFASHRVEDLALRLPPGATWESLLHRLAELGHRAAVVGPEGRGKTLLLDELAGRLAADGLAPRRITLRRGDRRLPPAAAGMVAGSGPDEVLLVDGAEQLGRLAWRRLARRSRAAGGLVVTSHRPGLLATLLTCDTTPALLAELTAELLAASSGSPPAELLPPAEELWTRHRGNLRHAFRELYDRCAALPQD